MAIALLALALAHSAEAATRDALARVRARDGVVHAVLALDPTALAQARQLDHARRRRGLLFGMPILLKDNIETAGPLPTTAGSLALAANVATHDAPIVARLRTAGAVILGKANLSEWANMRSSHSVSGWSAIGGQTRNPHAPARTPCGSSSGSAAAVAEGLVAGAIGTETDGSITCPASVNGVVGMKPTLGLVSRAGIVPLSHAQDTAGPLARDVATAARLLTAMAGSDSADPATAAADAHRQDFVATLDRHALAGARIGVVRLPGWPTSVRAAFQRALHVLRRQGAILIDLPAPPSRKAMGAAEGVALRCEFKADIDAYLATTPAAVHTRSLAALIAFNQAHAPEELSLFGQDVFEAAERTHIDDPACAAARARAHDLAGPDGLDRMLASARLTALIAPTIGPAWLIATPGGDPDVPGGIGGMAAVAGAPHLSVPMGRAAGLPIGLSFIGPAWSEARLLRLGYAYEQAAARH